eukprot:433599-Pyramimonas_sp.AAC.1
MQQLPKVHRLIILVEIEKDRGRLTRVSDAGLGTEGLTPDHILGPFEGPSRKVPPRVGVPRPQARCTAQKVPIDLKPTVALGIRVSSAMAVWLGRRAALSMAAKRRTSPSRA